MKIREFLRKLFCKEEKRIVFGVGKWDEEVNERNRVILIGKGKSEE